jgi:ArsR family transcriptional regulator
MSPLNPSDSVDSAPDFGCQHTPEAVLRLSSAEAESLAATLKALGHPVRLQIVDLLSRYSGQVCVCDLEQHFSLAQPTISHHLKVLREAGLVDSEQRGLWVYYRVVPDALIPLRRLWDQLHAPLSV